MNKFGIPKKIKIPIVDEDLAYICGVLAGDGSINIRKAKHDYAIKCVGNPKDEKEFYNDIIVPLFLKKFDLIVKSKLFDKKTTYGIQIGSKLLVKYLLDEINLPSGKKYPYLKIPPIFLKSTTLTNSFIQGLADTDFCLTLKRGYYPRIIGTSKSKKFTDQIYNYLINKRFKVYRNKREYYDVRVNKFEVTYQISLSGHKQLIKWMQEIGFRPPKNLKKIKIWFERNQNNENQISNI